MPSVKISQLPVLTQLSANNANTVFVAVDKTTNTTSQFSTTTLAAGLFANNVLNVGTKTPSNFPGLIAQFIANTAPYGQVNFQNANSRGSMDIVLTADIGNDGNNFVDLGINNSGYSDPQFSSMKAADGYLFVNGGQNNDYVGNLIIGTTASKTNVLFSVGGTTNLDVVAQISKSGLKFTNGGYITFGDGSTQSFAALPASVTLATQANTIYTQGVDITQNTRLNSIETVNADQNTNISIIQGVDITQNTRLNSIETINTNQNTEISIIKGVDITQNTRLNSIETVNADQNTAISIIQGVDITQNTRLNSIETVNADQNTSISVIQGIDTWQNTEITAVNNYAASGYAKANAALANTTGTFAGDLTITGDLTVVDNTTTNTAVVLDKITFNNNGLIRTLIGSGNPKDITILTGDELSDNESGVITLQTGTAPINATGGDINLISGVGGLGRGTVNLTGSKLNITGNLITSGSATVVGNLDVNGTIKANGIVTLNNSSFATNTAFLSIVASDDFVVVPPSNTNYMIHVTGKANSVTRVVLDSFGIGANGYPLYAGRQGRGSASLPLATGNNDVLLRITGNGYTGTQFPGSSPSKIDFVASENFSNTNRGTRIEFWNTPTGSNTIAKVASFNADSVEFTGAVRPDKGFIYTPNVITSGASTLNINFARDSLIKCNSSTGLTVSFTNYIYGKEVVVWYTNSGGSTQSVTHGCLANNSTTGSASFSMAAGSTAMLRYFSIDGSLGDTFVAVTQG